MSLSLAVLCHNAITSMVNFNSTYAFDCAIKGLNTPLIEEYDSLYGLKVILAHSNELSDEMVSMLVELSKTQRSLINEAKTANERVVGYYKVGGHSYPKVDWDPVTLTQIRALRNK